MLFRSHIAALVQLARLLKTGNGISARVAAPSVHFVTAHAALVSCWPLPQRLLPAFPLLSLCDIFPRPGEVFGRRPQSSPLQYQRKHYFYICKLEKSADFSNLLFHGRGRNWKMDFICGTTGSFSEDRPLGWDPVAAGNRAGDGMARFVSEEKSTCWPTLAVIPPTCIHSPTQ